MNIFTKRSLQALVAGSALIGSFALAGTALAAGPGVGHNIRPAVVGTVATAPDASGTFTVTVKSRQHGSKTTTTDTVTTTSATIVTKGGTASTVSAIAQGDVVMVQGTLTGTTVAATAIRDGKPTMLGKKSETDISSHTSTIPTTPVIIGNGQPIIGGNVTAITGSLLTVTNKSNVTYTVDATNASTTKKGVATAIVSNITIGDSILAQGSITGSTMTASSIIDQGTLSAIGNPSGEGRGGVMGAIGGFFSHLFGFF